jgi:hypothetical protein
MQALIARLHYGEERVSVVFEEVSAKRRIDEGNPTEPNLRPSKAGLGAM